MTQTKLRTQLRFAALLTLLTLLILTPGPTYAAVVDRIGAAVPDGVPVTLLAILRGDDRQARLVAVANQTAGGGRVSFAADRAAGMATASRQGLRWVGWGLRVEAGSCRPPELRSGAITLGDNCTAGWILRDWETTPLTAEQAITLRPNQQVQPAVQPPVNPAQPAAPSPATATMLPEPPALPPTTVPTAVPPTPAEIAVEPSPTLEATSIPTLTDEQPTILEATATVPPPTETLVPEPSATVPPPTEMQPSSPTPSLEPTPTEELMILDMGSVPLDPVAEATLAAASIPQIDVAVPTITPAPPVTVVAAIPISDSVAVGADTAQTGSGTAAVQEADNSRPLIIGLVAVVVFVLVIGGGLRLLNRRVRSTGQQQRQTPTPPTGSPPSNLDPHNQPTMLLQRPASPAATQPPGSGYPVGSSPSYPQPSNLQGTNPRLAVTNPEHDAEDNDEDDVDEGDAANEIPLEQRA